MDITPRHLYDNLPILQKASDAYKLWHSFLPHLPRLSRYTIGAKIDTLFTELLEFILLGGYSAKSQKLPAIQKASIKLDALKFFLQITWETKALDSKKYIRISEPLAEVGKMLGGWQRQLQKDALP